jgi:membrane-associated phospholipid phosphatase
LNKHGRIFLPQPELDTPPQWPASNRWSRLVVWSISQIALFLLLFQAYKLVRRTFITRAESVAFSHALDILALQGSLGLNFELSWQRWVLDRGDLILVFNYIYAYYMYGFYACAIALLVLAPSRYLYLRRVFILTMILALPWYAVYPLAPPRFMEPYGWPFVDSLAVYGPNYFSESGLVTANRFAAMPSMHCGWSLVAGIMIAQALPWRRVGWCICIGIALLMSVTVVVTGNHYWLDIIGGWAIVAAALVVNRSMPFPLPLRWPWQRTPSPTRTLPNNSLHSADN